MMLPERHPSYPPTVGEFLKILNELNVARPEHKEAPPLRIGVAPNMEIGKAAMDKIKALIRTKKYE